MKCVAMAIISWHFISGTAASAIKIKCCKAVARVERGVPQWSIPGPLLFGIFANGLEVETSADLVCSYANDMSFLIKDQIRDHLQEVKPWWDKQKFIWFKSLKLKLISTKNLSFLLNKKYITINIKGLNQHS